MMKYERRKALCVGIVLLCSILFALLAERGYSYLVAVWASDDGAQIAIGGFSSINAYRFILFFGGTLFIFIHFILKIEIFYDYLYRYRYLIAILLFVFLVMNKIHFSSIGMFNVYIQPDHGSDFREPIFGFLRAIRTDEWSVTTPIQLSAQYDPEPFGRFNMIARGAATENMPNGMALGLATLAYPMSIFYIFGAEYGVSARWVGTLIMTFMVTFEFAYIVSGKNRLLGVVGACLVTFSPFFQWWSYVFFVTSGIGTLVCLYYFINTETTFKKLLSSFGLIVFFSQFIVTLYPAWQVPAGFLYLGLALWIVLDNREKVKKFGKRDYMILGVTAILIMAVIATFLYGSREYIAGISNTIYPGTRHDSGGGGFVWNLNRMISGGVFAPISAFRSFVTSNICEFGGMYTLFPVPILFSAFMMIRKRIFDLLSIILIIYTLIVGSYVFIGWPEWFARVTFMSFSSPTRAADVLLFAQVFLLIRAMSRFTGKSTEMQNFLELKLLAGSLAVGIFLIYIIERFSRTTLETSLGFSYLMISMLGLALIVYSLFDKQRNQKMFKLACLYMICISAATWISIHPIMKGLDAIYSKPLSAKISELAGDHDEKWISQQGAVGPAYLIANGASTINSTNFYPNLELWYRLDPGRSHEHIYNRYANISVVLTTEETSFGLLHADHIILNLSYNDLATIKVKYIHTQEPLIDAEGVFFTLIYNEGGALIYSVGYDE